MIELRMFLLIFIFSAAVYSQELVEVFREHLPKRLLVSSEYKLQIEERLRQRAEIHPDLLYHYIRYYSELSTDSIRLDSTRRRVVERVLRDSERWYFYRRSIELKQYSSTLDSIGTDAAAAIKDILETMFLDSLSGAPIPGPPGAEINFQNYLSAVYYDRSIPQPFSPETNYASHRQHVEARWLEQTKTATRAQNISPYDGFDDAVRSHFNNWHLFSTTNSSANPTLPPHSAVDLYATVFSSSAQPTIGIGVGYSPYHAGFSAETIIPINNTSVQQPIRQSFQTKMFSLSGRYRFFISDFLARFSYISLSMGLSSSGAAAAVLPKLGFDNIYTTSERTYGTEYHESLQFFTLSISPEALTYADITLTTPVIVAVPWTIELGFRYSYLRTKYTLNYHYHYYLTEKYLVDGQFIQYYVTNTIKTSTDAKKETLSRIYHQFLPVADISYYFSQSIFLRTIVNHQFGSISVWLNLD